jgi:MerR family transcriptional regulator, copper efflux regulator
MAAWLFGSPGQGRRSRIWYMPPMTIGRLSRRTGVSVKTLREYEDMGLIYTVGRSSGNYRLFDEDALWCVNMVATMRALGLTLAEIKEVTETYLQRSDDPIGPQFAAALNAARRRITDRINELQATLERIDAFEAANRAELAGQVDFDLGDPRAKRGT